MKWFNRSPAIAADTHKRPSALEEAAGRMTVRHYPPVSYVESPIETAALAGRRLPGVCTICGAAGEFEPFNDNLRESGACPQCRSSNRQRQMAWMLRRELGLAFSGPLVIPEGVSVYNVEANGPLHEMLKVHPQYQCSEYWGDKAEFGEVVDGTRNEDLQALSFASASFDVVLTSDVLEHMPQPYRAHSEIHRVLKPGGRHIFTVPYGEAMIRDQVRASLIDGKVVHHHEAVFHGDPVRPGEGILVWTIFGLEMFVRLNEIGFETQFWRLHEPAFGIIGPGADVFIAHKPWS